MCPVPIPVDSDALRANIDRTAQPVVIPDRYRPLLEIVSKYLGVKGPLSDTLTEYFHAYRNIDLLVDGFQAILLRNWSYFERSERRTEAFSLLSELILDLLDAQLTAQQSSLLLRQLLTWCTAVLGGPHSDAYDEPLLEVASCLAKFVPGHTLAALERDNLLRNLLPLAARRPQAIGGLLRALPVAAPAWIPTGCRAPAHTGVGHVGEAELTDRERGRLDLPRSQPGADRQPHQRKPRRRLSSELLSAELPTFSR